MQFWPVTTPPAGRSLSSSQTLPKLKTEGTFDKEPVRTMTVPIDRTRGELAMLQRDCLAFKVALDSSQRHPLEPA